jgi:hypothetical protein
VQPWSNLIRNTVTLRVVYGVGKTGTYTQQSNSRPLQSERSVHAVRRTLCIWEGRRKLLDYLNRGLRRARVHARTVTSPRRFSTRKVNHHSVPLHC